MTSGRLLCPDCGRNSPQGRHASCHVLTILKANNGDAIPKRLLLHEVWPGRFGNPFVGEQMSLSTVDGAISTLRKQGHRIVSIDGYVKLRNPT